MNAAILVDRIAEVVRHHLPAGVSSRDLDGFLARNRTTMVRIVEHKISTWAQGPQAGPEPALPELWTPGKRTAANLDAMRIAATLAADGRSPTPSERTALAAYSGWGGLSIRGAADRFPAGFPVPEERGLIHEYYTPSAVASEVARLVRPLVPSLPDVDGVVHALEPSAGIGRFLRAFDSVFPDRLTWHAVEWSALSATMLAALQPDLDLHQMPFERWVRDHGAAFTGRLGLLVSNPPYGQRGASIAEDPDRAYRERMAYPYFLRRGLDLLAPNGLGVFLVPAGFLTGRTSAFVTLRENVLKRHHLAAAFRLPSMNERRREAIFPGAMLVTDLAFFRSRGGELAAVDDADVPIVAGRYFEQFPSHILGREVGDDQGEDDQTAKPRWGYQVMGEFSLLPDLVERPICADCVVVARPAAAAGNGRLGVVRAEGGDDSHLPRELAAAVSLGHRVDRYLALLAAEETSEPPLLWPELHAALTAWVESWGNPHALIALVKLGRGGNTGAERFLSAFDRSGALIAGLSNAPPVVVPRFSGQVDDVLALAEHLFRQHRALTVGGLVEGHRDLGGRLSDQEIRSTVLAGGWCLDGPAFDDLYPADVYVTGSLWPRYDRVASRPGDPVAVAQVAKLVAAIGPAVFDDIEGVSARQGWLPLTLITDWINETWTRTGGYDDAVLERVEGLVVPHGWEYDELSKKERSLHPEVLLLVGWMNHDKTLFSPSKRFDDDSEKDIDKARIKKAAEWDASFKGWVAATPERRKAVEDAYNRQFRGYVAPSYPVEPLPIARWRKDGPRMHPHQVAGARRILANRGGLLAFDVGVGKTYTGIAVLARARQEGWCRRPVVLVPNSIVWKWVADIERVLPDYRIAVVGSKRKVISRGERKGLVTSDTDTPAERAEKWTRFQAGEYDVVLLTYTALGRTRMNEGAVRAYAAQTEAIQREVALRRRNAAKRKKLSERDEAILREGIAAWVAQQMELADGWEYDPGIAWDDIGVDLLIVDEAQNFKNLYLPEPREGGVPRFMGNAGEGSKRAWQLDFRCAAVRRRTGGSGVVLLSATPAKNSPLEFYNLVQYVDHDAWSRMGIRDPEQFIDRYLRIDLKPVVDTKMEVVERSAVVGFQNLHELREVIFRYGEFKTAEDVGLKLPEPKVNVVEVDMSAAQDAKYERYVGQIEAALESSRATDKSKILGLLARMALVAIHPDLDEGYDWKTAASSGVDPSSPKFAAMTKRVLTNRTCGHIVFVDNIAAHRWVVQTLVKAGLPEARIAVLNAEVAPAAADRQRIAREFNGDGEDGAAPKFDVVIANAVAYEGIDLQTRTCAIHHLDLPWEPATLQQRNGRGVRQGNTLQTIEINYYFARRSQDGLRFNLIQGKLGWMTELLRSQARDTNNPGAQMDLGPEDILLLISRDPEKTARRLAEVKARREVEAKKKVAEDAARMLRGANARFRKAERAEDPAEAARLRLEGEERLKDLANVDPAAWPWARWMYAVRDGDVLVPAGGEAPVYEGLRAGVPSQWDPNRVQHVEFGRVRGTSIGTREAGTASWSELTLEKVAAQGLQPEHLDPTWPASDEADTDRAIEAKIESALRYGGSWPALGWSWASDAWVERAWAKHGARIVAKLAGTTSWYAEQQRVPVVVRGQLRVGRGSQIGAGEVLPPTLVGWRQLLELAPSSGLKFTEVEELGTYWWDRRIPRTLLSSAEAKVAA